MTDITIGQRVRQARTQAGLTLRSLADLIANAGRVDGLDYTALSRIENGKRRIASHELAELAEVLHTTTAALLGRNQRSAALALAARVTDSADPSYEGAAQRAVQILEADDLLTRVLGDTPAVRAPDIQVGDVAVSSRGGIELARRARDEMRLGAGPVPDLATLVEERFGTHVLVEEMEDGKHGFCAISKFPGDDTAAVIIVNARDTAGRRRFTLAHELCHLIAEDPVEVELLAEASNSQVERRADAFAAHFLAPDEGILELTGGNKVDAGDVARLSNYFGMSFQAMLIRLRELRLIGTSKFEELHSRGARSAYLAAGLVGAWNADTAPQATRYPQRLLSRALAAYAEGLVGVGLVADILGNERYPDVLNWLADAGHTAPELKVDMSVLA